MARRTQLQMVVDELLKAPKNRLSAKRIAAQLGWSEDRVSKVVESSLHDPAIPLQRGPGGVVKYVGSERHGSESGVYHDVRRVIEDYWAPRRLGVRRPRVSVTATSGRRSDGVWSHPDLAMVALPRRRRSVTDPPNLYSFEVETFTGFDIRSIYQAHAQGRGACQSWVFFATSDIATPHFDDRIMWAAEKLGIGLVEFSRSGSFSTYVDILDAETRVTSLEERAKFLQNTGIEDTEN